jgi:hypothetical protein
MIDRIAALPLPVRHAILAIVSAVLGALAEFIVPWLQGQPGAAPVAAVLLGAVLAYVTPLVQGYGLGTRSDYTKAA